MSAEASHGAPEFARVDIRTLRALRELAEDGSALAEKLDGVIEIAEQRASQL